MALIVSLPIAASAEIIDRIVAVVGGQIVTSSDVETAAALGLAGNLQDLVDRLLMLSEVHRVAPPDPAAAAVDARMAAIRSRFASPEAYLRALAAGGLDEAAVRSYASDDLRLSAYLDDRFLGSAQPTDEEVRQAGEASRERLVRERRQALVTAWVAELRRRIDVTVIQ